MFEDYRYGRYCSCGPSWMEKAHMARMAWTGFHAHHGRTGRNSRRGKGKGASNKGA